MTPKITDEMRNALQQQSGKPVTIEDEQTHLHYVLLPLDAFEKVRVLFDDDEFDIADTYPAQDQALQRVWDDPALDVYNDYDASRKDS